jgi:hypothetical protein
MAAGAHAPTARMLGQLRLNIAKRENLLDPEPLRVPLGRRLSDVRLARGREALGVHAPSRSRRRSNRTPTARVRSRQRARARLRPGAQRQRDRRRQHPDPRPALQRLVFKLLGMSDEEAKARFGFFVDALEFGTPPHGGIALGLDRIVAILAGEQSIREVIAFPKTAQAVDLMAGAPSTVDPKQLGSCTSAPNDGPHRRTLGTATARLKLFQCQPPRCARFRSRRGAESLFGTYDENLKQLESQFGVRIRTAGSELIVEGEPASGARREGARPAARR